MPWPADPAKRRQDAKTYGSPEYKRNRELARQRARGYCEQCGHRHDRLQCDHTVPVSQGGGHALANLRMLCAGPGTCKCHEAKTASEGGGYRSSNRRPANPRREGPGVCGAVDRPAPARRAGRAACHARVEGGAAEVGRAGAGGAAEPGSAAALGAYEDAETPAALQLTADTVAIDS